MSDKRVVILNPQRRHLVEAARQDWVVDAEEGTTIDDVLEPAYWSHVAAEFSDLDHVEVRIETGEWIVELTVLQHDRNWAKMFLRQKYLIQDAMVASTPTAKHRVEYKGPHLKHCVVRIADSEVIEKGIATKVDADRWMRDYESRTSVAA